MSNEVDYFYLNNPDAIAVAKAMEDRLGIEVQAMGDCNELASSRVYDEALLIDPARPFLVYNGSGYFHNSTLTVVRDLVRKRRAAGMPEISYVHIDGHDDIAPPQDGSHAAYKSFVLGVADVTRGGAHVLREGLTGERDAGFIIPAGPETWGDTRKSIRDLHAYLSIDLDVLDIDALKRGEGVYHLFPQKPIGFDVPRLLTNIAAIGGMVCLVGADLVGFSREGASTAEINQSYDNIARITSALTNILTKSEYAITGYPAAS